MTLLQCSSRLIGLHHQLYCVYACSKQLVSSFFHPYPIYKSSPCFRGIPSDICHVLSTSPDHPIIFPLCSNDWSNGYRQYILLASSNLFYVALSKSIEMKRLFTSLKYISIGLNHILDAWVAKVNLGIFRHVSPFSQIYCFHLNVDVLVHLVSYECVCPCSSVLLRRGFNHTIFWLIC